MEHCVIAVISSEVAKFEMPQIKRRYNVFLICPAVPARVPVALEWGFGGVETTVQKYKLFPTWRKKNVQTGLPKIKLHM